MLIRIMILILLVATACAPQPVQEPAPLPDSVQNTPSAIVENTPEAPPDPTATPASAAEDSVEKKFTQIVMRDLAARLSLELEAISPVSFEPIEWPNSALGCPAPGGVYTQATIPGFRIRLEADNQEYSYHLDRTGRFVLCTEDGPDLEDRPSLPVQPGEIDDGDPWVPVN